MTIRSIEQILNARPNVQVTQIGIAAAASTLSWVDDQMRPLGSTVEWSNQSSRREAADVQATRHPVLGRMLGHVSPEWGLPKFLMMARAGVPSGARYVVELLDWINWQFTGNLVANTGIREWGWSLGDDGRWPRDMFDQLGLTPFLSLLAEEQDTTGATIGQTHPRIFDRVPQLRGANVTMGGMDSYAAGIGLGVARVGRMCLSFGSSSSFLGGRELGDASMTLYGPMRWAMPFLESGCWQGGQSTAGLAIAWIRRILRLTYPALEYKAKAIAPGSENLLFRETLLGRRNPNPDPDIKGMWHGVNLDHEAGHLYRSVLEAIALGTRFACRDLQPKEVVVTGGLTRSRLFLSILADVLECPVGLPRSRQSAAFGAAFSAQPTRIPELNPIRTIVEPSGIDYREIYDRYETLHRAHSGHLDG